MAPHDTGDFPDLARARALWAQEAGGRALEAFAAAVAARPRNVRALLEAARAFGGAFEIGRAEALLGRAEALAGADPRVAAQIAVGYGRIYREARAIALLEAVSPRPPGLRAELAALYEQTNRLDAALAEIEACIAAAPEAAEPRLARARILRRQGADAAARAALEGLAGATQPPALRAEAWTELCYLHDRAGEPEAAVRAIHEAHALRRARPGTERLIATARANNAAVARLAAALGPRTLARWRAEALPADPRVSGTAHLVGFPRSGTTLLEQCLDAHPGLVASPERALFTRTILPELCAPGGGRLSMPALERGSRGMLRRLRRRYLDGMEGALGTPLGGRMHLDKNPNHTGLLPALLRLFPESRIVVALRDPRDVVTSCVLRSFRLTEFSAMLLDWSTAAELYAAEMGAWLRIRAALDPGDWVEVRYEDVIADPMGETRRALDGLGLGWHPEVARYRDRLATKAVHSPTQTEVRQPVYGHAAGRWKAYRRHLDPHMAVLAPFIEAFGYDLDAPPAAAR